MRIPRLLLAMLMLPSAVAMADAPPRGTSRYQAATESYRSLAAADQQEWLRSLVIERMQPAAELALSGGDLDRQQNFAVQVLQRAESGRTLSDEGVKTLLSRTDQLEKAAVERLARLYRVGVYQTFRGDRRELDLRMAAWRRVELAFADAGGMTPDRKLLLAWLQEAVTRMNRSQAALLPAMPKFGGAPQVAKTTPSSVAPSAPAAPSAPPAPSTRPLPSAQPSKLRPTEGAPSKIATAPSTLPRAADTGRAALPKAASKPPVALPDAPRPAPAATTPAPPQVALHVVERPVRPVAPPTVSSSIPLPPATARQVKSKASPNINNDRASHAGPAVQVDLDELTIRITGYNLALSGLANRLHEGELRLSGLEEAVEELAELAVRRGDLELYRNLLSDSVSRQMAALDSYAAVLSILGGKISAARKQFSAADFSGTPTERRQNLAALDALSRQLAQLAATGEAR